MRYWPSHRDLEEKFQERGFEVDQSMINRWVLAFAIENRCGPVDAIVVILD
ncbi:hypothetical protein RLEG3_02835 (plasmid) [Rhizobium leguminosarum bv. trifolii WSM1689]|nr:hypothetical protein RLEG3_02835 [Rhizobium leguminosarum bv. trifolii WSM1689]